MSQPNSGYNERELRGLVAHNPRSIETPATDMPGLIEAGKVPFNNLATAAKADREAQQHGSQPSAKAQGKMPERPQQAHLKASSSRAPAAR